MWTQKPLYKLVEAVDSPLQFPDVGTCRRIRLPAAEEKVAAEEEVAAVEDVSAVD